MLERTIVLWSCQSKLFSFGQTYRSNGRKSDSITSRTSQHFIFKPWRCLSVSLRGWLMHCKVSEASVKKHKQDSKLFYFTRNRWTFADLKHMFFIWVFSMAPHRENNTPSTVLDCHKRHDGRYQVTKQDSDDAKRVTSAEINRCLCYSRNSTALGI